MRKKCLLVFILFFCLKITGQVEVKFGAEGLRDNSTIMFNALCNCYGKDSVIYWLDSLSYYGVFICEINSNGFVVDIPKYWSKKLSFNKDDLEKIKKSLQRQNTRFSIVYENEFGDIEDSLKIRKKKEIKRYFRHHLTHTVTVGFPGKLSSPWEKYMTRSITGTGLIEKEDHGFY